MIQLVIIVISLLLDGLLTNFLPFLINDLSVFTPLLTLTIIFLIYPFYKKNKNKYLITAFIIGIIYDLFYTNLLFFNGVLFFIIALISMTIYKNLEVSYLRLLIYIPIIIISYEVITAIILFSFNVVPITITKVIYKILHSLLLNVIYGEIIFLY